MNASEPLGWLAATLMLAAFCCKDARWLRAVAIGANLAFIAYGMAAQLHPIAALHLMLLPVNVCRLASALKDAERARRSSASAAASAG